MVAGCWHRHTTLALLYLQIISTIIVNCVTVVFTGGQMKESGSYLAEVLRYDVAADSWFPAESLTEARRSFAVALLTYDVLQQFCPEKNL